MKNCVTNNLSLVSVIIPCRNEEKFIGECLDSIISQDYRLDRIEALVIDGVSTDKTREIVKKYEMSYSFIKLLDNPKKITPCALNIGIKQSKGELILWMSAHNIYEKDYISKCVKYLNEYNANNVGGVIITLSRENTSTGRTIAYAISHKFGIGNSIFRSGSNQPKWVDTVFGSCYKREVFEKIGLFNEKLIRGQDLEFNLRLKKAGLRTLLVPEIVSYYYARSDLSSFIKHNFINGLWAILPFKYTNIIPISLRHLVPLLFVLSLIFFGILSFFIFWAKFLFFMIISLYLLCNILFSLKISLKQNDLRHLFLMPLIFLSLHISYGIGSVLGLVNCIFSKEFWLNQVFKKHV